MNADSIAIIRQLVGAIDGALPQDRAAQTQRARRLFRVLGREGGMVEALGAPAFQRTRIDELGTWTEDPWPGPTYGVDASTTRPLEYNNGLIVDVAHARTAVSGAEDHRIEQTGRVVGVAYLDDPETTLRTQAFEGEDVRADLLRFPAGAEETRNLAKSVSAVAQRLSESAQALDTLDEISGALFLDGAVLPLGIVYWLLRDAFGRQSPASTWDVPRRIAEHYVTLIDRQHERGHPVIGVVKTSSMKQVLDALRAKMEMHPVSDEEGRPYSVPWMHDHQWIAQVLQSDRLDELTYTSWFVSKGQDIEGQSCDLLDPVAGHLGHGAPADYRRAFFYVRLPRTGDVLRVETPLLMAQGEERRRQVQLKALKEIARRRGVPQAIQRADRLARIGRDNRSAIRAMIEGAEATFDHNRDGRWKDIELAPEV